MVSQVLVELNADMQKCVDGLSHELGSVRTGRASPALIEDIPVDYHGSVLPILRRRTVHSFPAWLRVLAALPSTT